MKHSIRFHDTGADVVVTTSGTASLAGLDAVVQALLADSDYVPGLRVVFDHSRLDWSGLQARDLVRRLHLALKAADLIGPRRIAVVSAEEQMLAELTTFADEPTTRAFATRGEAYAWLGTAVAAGCELGDGVAVAPSCC
jgi:hypothetical protein